jgi:hypothetical protein
MLDLNSSYILLPNIVLKSVNNKFWALDTLSGKQFKLNRTAFEILSALSENVVLDKIFNEIAQPYDVLMEVFIRDASNLIQQAINNGIVEKR